MQQHIAAQALEQAKAEENLREARRSEANTLNREAPVPGTEVETVRNGRSASWRLKSPEAMRRARELRGAVESLECAKAHLRYLEPITDGFLMRMIRGDLDHAITVIETWNGS
jgi:hypothetical protein